MLKTVIAILFVIGAALATESPVFLFGAESPVQPALQKLSNVEFSLIVAPLLENHMILAFEEDDLTIADLHHCKSGSKSCFTNLKAVQPKTYYPNVENADEALVASARKVEKNVVNKKLQLDAPLKCEAGKVVLISFNDPLKSREELLADHDAAISNIVSAQSCPVVYLYMSKASRLQRSRRATAAPEGGFVFRTTNPAFLIFFTKLAVLSPGSTTPVEVNIDEVVVTEVNKTALTVQLTGSATIKFTVVYNLDGYNYMKEFTYNGNAFRTRDVTAPPQFSYYCGNLTLYKSDGDGTQLMWDSVQFQAPFGTVKGDDFPFSDSWNCVGFFTPGILSGLFVSIILLFITFTGICWMMDINTMDRFDDPKGKTITINATD